VFLPHVKRGGSTREKNLLKRCEEAVLDVLWLTRSGMAKRGVCVLDIEIDAAGCPIRDSP